MVKYSRKPKTYREVRVEAATWILLLLLFFLGQLLVSVVLTLPWSPAFGGDSPRYLEGSIEQGTAPYAGYIALIWFAGLIGTPSVLIVILQSLLAIVAARALLAVGQELNSPFAGWISACWFLLFIEVVQWTRYILTESLFYSVTVILVFIAIRTWNSVGHQTFLLILISVLGSTLRPNGFILVGAVFTFILVKHQKRVKVVVGVIVVWSILLFSQISIPALSTHDTGSFYVRFLSGEVFWNQADFQRVMPNPSSAVQGATDMLFYVLEHPVDSIALVLSRVGWEIVQYRPWYSDFHNLYIVLLMAIFYAAAFVGWLNMRGSNLNLFIWCLTIPSIFLIGATWAIYEGRFGWWFLVAWITWVGIGTKVIFDWVCLYFTRFKTKDAHPSDDSSP